MEKLKSLMTRPHAFIVLFLRSVPFLATLITLYFFKIYIFSLSFFILLPLKKDRSFRPPQSFMSHRSLEMYVLLKTNRSMACQR